MKHINVLFVDDELNNLESFRSNFRRHYNVFTSASAAEAKELLSSNEIHVLVTDQKMPLMTGTTLLEESIRVYPYQARILLSAYVESEAVLEAFQKGLIFKYVQKPYVPEVLKKIIDAAYEMYTLKQIKDELYREWLQTREELSMLRSGEGLVK